MTYLNLKNLLIIILYCSLFLDDNLVYADLTDDIHHIDKPSHRPTKSDKNNKPLPIKQKKLQKKKPKTSPKTEDAQRNLPIHYSSQNLRGDRSAGLLQLKQNVSVTQGNLKVTSQDAKIYFSHTEEMEKVEALGDVVIHTIDPETGKNVRAQSQRLDYIEKDRMITLSGDAKLWRGDDILQGQVIQYHLDTGWIKVQKVRGQLNPTQKAD